MDGKGCALDNIFLEPRWRSGKHEGLCVHEFQTVAKLHAGLDAYCKFYSLEGFTSLSASGRLKQFTLH